MDKKNEQGALGEAFDAALKAVRDGAGAEDAPDEDTTSGSFSKAEGVGNGSSTAKAAAERVVGRYAAVVPELAGSLRHVWFDFHHEVCWIAGGGGGVVATAGKERHNADLKMLS